MVRASLEASHPRKWCVCTDTGASRVPPVPRSARRQLRRSHRRRHDPLGVLRQPPRDNAANELGPRCRLVRPQLLAEARGRWAPGPTRV